jgi:hypothetical protein
VERQRQSTKLDLQAVADAGTRRGRLDSEADGRPVEDALVRLTPWTQELVFFTRPM